MIKSALIFSLSALLNTTTVSSTTLSTYSEKYTNEINELQDDLDWSKIELEEIEEDVEIGFDTKAYLPENFNPLKGKYDLHWDKIELIQLDEEVQLNFNTKTYLPENFNPLKGKYDLNWDTIELVDLEDEVSLNFDTKKYLPEGFDSSKNMHSSEKVL